MPNTIHFLDSFDFYVTADIDKHWTIRQGGPTIVAAGRWGTNCMSTSPGDGVIKQIAAGETTHYFGFNHKRATFVAAGIPIAELRDTATNTCQVTLMIDPAGKLAALRGTLAGGAYTTLGTGTTIFTANVDRHISCKVVIDDTVGEFVVKVNGITEINLSGVDTKTHATVATADRFGLNSQVFTASETHYFDDFWWNNYADFGDVRVEALFPSGAGATTNFTPSAGANWQCVDEVAENGDTDYVSSATPGDIDTYGFTNLTPTSGTIKAVGIHMMARKDDAGVRTIAPVWRDSGVNNVGGNQNIGASYNYITQYYEKNPQTAAAATITEINADEYGVKEVA